MVSSRILSESANHLDMIVCDVRGNQDTAYGTVISLQMRKRMLKHRGKQFIRGAGKMSYG